MKSVSVAIVDDHKLFCRSLEVMVNRFKGFSVLFTASDGLDFIGKLRKQLRMPDIVIMDQFMPIMDGYQFREYQLANTQIKDIPVVVMSADGHIIEKSMRTSAHDYIKKPLDIFHLLTVVEKFVA